MTFKEFLEKYNIPHTIEIINKELEIYVDENGKEVDEEFDIIVSDEDLYHFDKELKVHFPDYKYDYESDNTPNISAIPQSPNN